jgi:hypothetical protein
MRCWLIAPDRHQSQKKTPPGGGHTSSGADRYDNSLHGWWRRCRNESSLAAGLPLVQFGNTPR